jgi:hypothetical protein
VAAKGTTLRLERCAGRQHDPAGIESTEIESAPDRGRFAVLYASSTGGASTDSDAFRAGCFLRSAPWRPPDTLPRTALAPSFTALLMEARWPNCIAAVIEEMAEGRFNGDGGRRWDFSRDR